MSRQRSAASTLGLVGAVGLACTGAAAAVERQIAPGGGPWCARLASLRPYVEAVLHGDHAGQAAAVDCAWLDAGTVVDIPGDVVSQTDDSPAIPARLVDRGGRAGYTVVQVVEEFHRADTSARGGR